jgi:3-hydroxybutyryl-CoA dehydratase
MVLSKKRKLGRKIDELVIGDKISLTAKIEDKDLLLYLGLTDDANPLYIQHDYASQTPYEKPIVPSIMLTGIISSAVSMHLPGPGSHILSQEIEFLKQVYHYSQVEFLFEIVEINPKNHTIIMTVVGNNEENEAVVKGKLIICPPYRLAALDGRALENF